MPGIAHGELQGDGGHIREKGRRGEGEKGRCDSTSLNFSIFPFLPFSLSTLLAFPRVLTLIRSFAFLQHADTDLHRAPLG